MYFNIPILFIYFLRFYCQIFGYVANRLFLKICLFILTDGFSPFMFAFIDILGLHCAILLFLFKLAHFFCSFLFFLNSLDIFNLTPKELKCVLIFLCLSIASHQRPFLTLCPSPCLSALQFPETTTRVLYNSAHSSPGQGKVLSLECM